MAPTTKDIYASRCVSTQGISPLRSLYLFINSTRVQINITTKGSAKNCNKTPPTSSLVILTPRSGNFIAKIYSTRLSSFYQKTIIFNKQLTTLNQKSQIEL